MSHSAATHDRIGFGEHPAILVIDFMKAFTDPLQPLGTDMSAPLRTTRTLVGQTRAAGFPVVFTRVCYDEPDGQDAGVWGKKVGGSRGMLDNNSRTELDPGCGFSPGDCVITKKYPSAFFATDLVSRLQTWRIDTLLLTGCSTSGCLRATAVDGLQYGYRVMVVKEAVADRDPAAHGQSLLDLDAKYADVVTAAEVTSYLSDLAPAPAAK